MNDIVVIILVAILCGSGGLLFGGMLRGAKRSDENEQAFEGELARQDLQFLEDAECSVLFNPQHNMWGLVDEQNKLIAGGRTIRELIARARSREGELA